MSILIDKISKTYSSQLALDNISFEVKKGEIAGFIGPNGAGKSTLMKIIMGYIPPGAGTAFVNGMDVSEHSLEIRKVTGYLPENNPLYPEMYVIEYLEYAAGYYMNKKEAKHSVSEIVKETGLERECHKKISSLSKGYRQRVGIAQALLHNPEILILDEPTSGLDPNQIIEIRNLISRVGKNKTVMLSTHIMQEVEAICNRVIIIDKGRLVADEETSNISRQVVESTNTIQVEFSQPPPLDELKGLEGIRQIKHVKDNVYLIAATDDKDIRADIFNFAVKYNIAVLSMQKKEMSLEEVFRALVGRNS